MRHGRCYSTRSIINSFGYLDEIFPTTNRCRPQRRRHIGFSIFWHATPPVQLSAYMSGDFQNEKYRSRGANSPQNKHRTCTRACAHHWTRIYIARPTSEFIFGPLFDRLSQIPLTVRGSKIIPTHMYTRKPTCNIMFSYLLRHYSILSCLYSYLLVIYSLHESFVTRSDVDIQYTQSASQCRISIVWLPDIWLQISSDQNVQDIDTTACGSSGMVLHCIGSDNCVILCEEFEG